MLHQFVSNEIVQDPSNKSLFVCVPAKAAFVTFIILITIFVSILDY